MTVQLLWDLGTRNDWTLTIVIVMVSAHGCLGTLNQTAWVTNFFLLLLIVHGCWEYQTL